MIAVMVNVGEKLKIARASRYPVISQREAAKLVGISREAVASYENGRNEPLEKYVRVWASAWGIPFEWFYDKLTGPPPPLVLRDVPASPFARGAMVSVPHWGKVPAGSFERPSGDTYFEDMPASYVEPGCFLLEADGNSMEPTIESGDTLVIRPTASPPLGSIVIVISPDKQLAVKRYRYKAGKPALLSDNPEYPPLDTTGVEFIGQVRRLVRDTF